MRNIADLVAYDHDGQIALIVEAKSRTNTSSAWATEMRRNIFAHGSMPASRYFMLALPDKLYLWKNAGLDPKLVEPTYEINSAPFFKAYYEKARLNPSELGGKTFELIVTSWINELIQSGVPDSIPQEQRNLLISSGLPSALQGGSVAVEQPL